MSIAVEGLKYGVVLAATHFTQKQAEKLAPQHSIFTTLFSSSLVGMTYQQAKKIPEGSVFTRRTSPLSAYFRSAARSSLFFSTYALTRHMLEKGNGKLPPLLKINNGFVAGALAGTALATIRFPIIQLDRPMPNIHYSRSFMSAGLAGAAFEGALLLAQKRASSVS